MGRLVAKLLPGVIDRLNGPYLLSVDGESLQARIIFRLAERRERRRLSTSFRKHARGVHTPA